MEQLQRKKLRLAGYDYSQSGAYFITVCTKDRQCLLSTIVGADDHIGPQTTPAVGADDHIGPQTTPAVGADDHIGPRTAPHTGADDHIGPQVQLTPTGCVVEKYLQQLPGVGEYVIMPNHVHMIVYVSAKDPTAGPMWSSATENGYGPMWSSAPTSGVPNRIRTWKTLITKELGIGIWQRSYYDHIIRDEQDLLTRLRYIQENPAKWYEDDYYTQFV